MAEEREILARDRPLGRIVRGVIGLAMIGEAVILGQHTVDALEDNSSFPPGLIFQQQLHNSLYDQPVPWNNYEIANGIALNVLAMGGLAGGGLRSIRRSIHPPQAHPRTDQNQ